MAQPDHPVAILGTGFAGLGLAIRLEQRGQRDFVVLERAHEVGGTWRDNTYPGCQCDIPSHLYSSTTGGCASWYIDRNGLNTTLWPGWTWDFRRRTRRFDAGAYALA